MTLRRGFRLRLSLPIWLGLATATALYAQPDLVISKSHTVNFFQGQVGATYTISVRNNGTSSTSGLVTVTDNLPAGLTATNIAGTGWSCTQPAGPCTRSDALSPPSGPPYPDLILTVDVAANAPPSVTNQATVSGGGETNLGNDTASDLTTISPSSDLTITKTHAGNFSPGQIGATYTITVTNVGGAATTPVDAFAEAVSDTVPAGLTATDISGAGWNCTQPAGPCTRGDPLPPGDSFPPLTVTVNVANDAPPLVVNAARLTLIEETGSRGRAAIDPTVIQQPGATITSVSPNSAPAGIAGVQITVSGTGFTVQGNGFPGSVVTWTAPNSQPVALQTSLTPTGQLFAFIPGSLLQIPLIATINVVQGGGPATNGVAPAISISNGLPFTVRAPSITSLSPPSASAGGPGFTLTVNGADFVNNSQIPSASQIVFGGTALATTFVNSGTLTAQITAAMIQTVGPVNVTVVNPGGSVSNIAVFNKVGLPTLISLSPSSAVAGGPAFPLTVNGTNFTSGLSILWNGAALAGTTLVNASQLIATVPANLIATAGTANVSVTGVPQSLPFTIVPRLVITTAALPGGAVGSNYSFRLTGAGGTPPFVWTATGLPGGLSVNAATGDITGIPSAVGTATVLVTLRDGGGQTAQAQFALIIAQRLTITTVSLPGGTVGTSYFFRLTATGGTVPYTWSSAGLPGGLLLNPATGDISGSPLSAGTFPVSVGVTDAGGQTAQAQFTLSVVQPPPPPPPPPTQLLITTASPLPQGSSGVAYSTLLIASGGTSPYTFSLAGGSLPAGLTLSDGGLIAGTPTTPGQSLFTARVTDFAGAAATKDFLLVIVPGPLVVTGAVSDGEVGAGITIKFGATGGVPPYVFSASGSLPPDTKFASDGTLSGTFSAVGTFTFSVTVTDFTGATASKSFTIKVTAPPLTITTTALANGQVGVGYAAQLAATGGVPPYTWTASGLPANLSISASGAISGAPASDGTSTVSVTVTDSAKTQVSRTFSLVITPAPLVISTTSLANGTVGVAYQATLAATGGIAPYTWSFTGLPDGVTGSSDGTLGGSPTTVGTSNVGVTVTDSKGVTATKTFSLAIVAPPLVITTASIPNATAGAAVSFKFSATGGVPPLVWSATGQPGTLNVAADGTLSGTPTAPATVTIAVTVKDSVGASATKSFSLTIVLPPSPGLNLTGLPPNSNPNPTSQPRVGVRLPTSYPLDVNVKLTLTFAADSGPDDPAVQFQGGGRTVQILVPAGSTTGLTDVGVQVGTVAGTITITAQLTAASQDITPSPAPAQTLRISPAAPVIVPPVTATSSSTGFTVSVTGFSSTRELTQAVFQFTAASGGNLQTTQLTVPVGSLFATWFQSSASAGFGSQFTLTQPFTISGSTKIVSVTVTLTNSVGTSAPVTANVQ